MQNDSLPPSWAIQVTAITGAVIIGLGAFGAHGLEELLQATDREDTWATATLYALTHLPVLLFLSLHSPWRKKSWISFFSGILIFSGSLYLLSLTNISILGAITPIGGLLLIAGWLLLIPKQGPK